MTEMIPEDVATARKGEGADPCRRHQAQRPPEGIDPPLDLGLLRKFCSHKIAILFIQCINQTSYVHTLKIPFIPRPLVSCSELRAHREQRTNR